MCASSCNKTASISLTGRLVKAAAGNNITGLKCPITIGTSAIADLKSITGLAILSFALSFASLSFQNAPASYILLCFKR